MYNGYDFYFKIGNDLLTLPITPSELTITSGSNNKVVTLINEGDINILKSPSLMEIEFDARFPMREYPYSRWKSSDFENRGISKVWNSNGNTFENYFAKFTKAKETKTPIRFSVVRTTGGGQGTWGTGYPDGWLVSLEELTTKESADEGDDVIVSFKLKQYKEYGVKILQTGLPTTTSTSDGTRGNDGKGAKSETYTVKPGDCLWNIAKAAYGDGSKWKAIYEANKSIIESTAEKRRGKGKSSQNGHWIYPGTKLIIPGVADANLTVQKLQDDSTKTYLLTLKLTGSSKGLNGVSVQYVYNKKTMSITNRPAGTYNIKCDANTIVIITAHDVNKNYTFKVSYPKVNGKWSIVRGSTYTKKITKNLTFEVKCEQRGSYRSGKF